MLALVICIIAQVGREATQTLPPPLTLPTHPRVTSSPPLHPVGAGPRIEAVQLGVLALFMARADWECAGLACGDEDVAHFNLEYRERCASLTDVMFPTTDEE